MRNMIMADETGVPMLDDDGDELDFEDLLRLGNEDAGPPPAN
jgi:hypothetical protein